MQELSACSARDAVNAELLQAQLPIPEYLGTDLTYLR